MRDKKHENRNELVFILDELLRQKAISHEAYTQVNNLLAESLGENDNDDESKEIYQRSKRQRRRHSSKPHTNHYGSYY